MTALITGASSGIGRDMARILSNRGYDLILVARRIDRLEELKNELPTKVECISLDLSDSNACVKLHSLTRDRDVDILVNNAGFGLFGAFDETDLERELNMIDVNIKAVHTLTKLFLIDFKKRNSGYILNVSSLAGFMPGPLLSGYYATKAYVLRLTYALHEELRRSKSNVYIGALCPGPVKTEFDEVADVRFSLKGLTSEYVAKYAVDKMFKRKLVIVPGMTNRFLTVLTKVSPTALTARINYKMQKRKHS